MSMSPIRRTAVVSAGLLAAVALAGCSSGGAATTVQVTSSATECGIDPASAPAGSITFTVENTGSQTTEFYVYEQDGTTIVGEVENIGPGLSRDLTVDLTEGTYVGACKPGMTGDGIRTDFDVTAAE